MLTQDWPSLEREKLTAPQWRHQLTGLPFNRLLLQPRGRLIHDLTFNLPIPDGSAQWTRWEDWKVLLLELDHSRAPRQ